MNCPTCGALMYAIRDIAGKNRVFQCVCGDQKILKILKANGNRYCPVCQSELVYIHSKHGLSDYWRCEPCCEKATRRLQQDPILVKHLVREDSFPLWLRLVGIMLAVVMIISGAAVVVDAKAQEALKVELVSDELFTSINERQNVGNDEQSFLTVIDQWRTDLAAPPNGTYFGTLLAGSGFEHNTAGYWIPKSPGDYLFGRWSYWMIGAHFNWSAQVLMNGASEWWIMLPVLASSFEVWGGITVCIWEGSDLENLSFYPDDYYNSIMHIRPSMNGIMPRMLTYFFPQDLGSIGAPATEGSGDLHLNNDHIYLRCRAVLRPNTDYVISILGRLPDGGRLTTIWTTAEQPAGMQTAIAWGDYRITAESSNHTVLHQLTGNFNQVIGLDLAWSFIFAQGIGEGGLFGHRLDIENGSMLITYPFLNTTLTGVRYPSFMLPWISTDTFNITVIVANSIEQGGTHYFHTWQFDDPIHEGETSWFGDPAWEYRDFALFSTQYPLDFLDAEMPFEGDDQWNVAVTYLFNSPGNLTLLCYDKEWEDIEWSTISDCELNTTKWPYSQTRFFTPELGGYDIGFGVWSSGRGTVGQWAVVSQDSFGHDIYSFCFPNKIVLSKAEWKIFVGDRNVTLSPAEQAWVEFQDLWGQKHYIRAIGAGIKAAVLSVWEGGAKLWGRIKDGLSNVWEGMKAIGSWIWTKLVEFYHWITDFITDLADLIIDWWSSAQYMVAPLMFMAIFGLGSRAFRRYAKGGDE